MEEAGVVVAVSCSGERTPSNDLNERNSLAAR
jgi:hypothetical protein